METLEIPLALALLAKMREAIQDLPYVERVCYELNELGHGVVVYVMECDGVPCARYYGMAHDTVAEWDVATLRQHIALIQANTVRMQRVRRGAP